MRDKTKKSRNARQREYAVSEEYEDFYDLTFWGAVVLKEPPPGPASATQRQVAECTSGMLNSVGLQNPGIDAVISQELPRLRGLPRPGYCKYKRIFGGGICLMLRQDRRIG